MKPRTTLIVILTAFVCAFAVPICASGRTIYVDADAAGANNGSSWENAYFYLQDALADANVSAKPVEIRVAQGTYKPDENELHPDGSGNEDAVFQLINGATIRGGYAGFGQPDPNKRDISAYCTILSGDIDDNDEPDSTGISGDNSRCIVNGSETDDTAVLDGVTITGGYGGIEHTGDGGGMYIAHGSPTIANCSFKDNRAGDSGGGICSLWNSNPTLTDCTFIGNSAGCGGGICTWERLTLIRCTFNGNSAGCGGGIYYGEDAPTLIDCRFSRNTASGYGGAIGSHDAGGATMVRCVFENNRAPEGGGIGSMESYPRLTNCIFINNSAYSGGGIWSLGSYFSLSGCTFTGNSASETGGAIANYGSELIMTSCSFAGNSASETGGAIATYDTQAILGNCTFGMNKAEKGSALVGDDYHYYDEQEEVVQITNCILWDSGNEIWNGERSVITVSHSNIRGGQASIYDPCNAVIWGEGNIDVDPCFADPGCWEPNGMPEDGNDDFWVDGDYHLKSQGGRYDSNEGRWVIDDVMSPCIDAGDPMSPIGDEPFPNGGIINMGAHGGTAEASKSYFGGPPCETIVAGDINGDCEVNFSDLCIMALHWCEDHNL